jgi:C4-dicarboxylate transporter, DctM subunit
MGWTLALLPVVLLVLGFPFFVILLATAASVLFFFSDVPATVIPQVIFSSIDKYALLAVPFFIFAGDLMGSGQVSRSLVALATSLIGGVRGSLPLASLGTATLFGAISGSTAATTAAVGGVMYQRLREEGYDERFASALFVSAGAIANLIPPSIGFILYGIAAETSIVRLFAAGIVPGLVMAVFFGGYVYAYARRHEMNRGAPFRVAEFLSALRGSLWALGAPVIILGGIYSGVFSPTEAAGVAGVYAIILAMFVYREAGAKDIFEAAARSLYLTAKIFVIVAAAGVYSWLLTVGGYAGASVQFIESLHAPPWAVLLAINILLLVVGCFLDTASSILVLTPLLAPIARNMGVDPVHFGVIVVMNLSIGTFTPPFGIDIFVGQAVFRAKLSAMYAGLVPFIIASVLALQVVTYVPQISLWLLRYLH